ncbi:transposase family protein [Streptomyces sp. DG2A-72]|uniref:transposase family protein n=1 Tax=Streptomyces sp. DG2A-72 TaxID=3051386 RepID=UPI00265C7F8E|nr:transposase family protein [Streptomyces sp. DG2A-72]MDO0938719.1 transposase family protein [Streptomyces sp. DG2A-72]
MPKSYGAEAFQWSSAVALPINRVFARIRDPRERRGRRHPLPYVLVLAAGAVLTGATTFLAIAEWAADQEAAHLAAAGARLLDVEPERAWPTSPRRPGVPRSSSGSSRRSSTA